MMAIRTSPADQQAFALEILYFESKKGSGRPVYPPKIKSVRIVDNPFDDIVPRITAAEKRAQQRAKEEARREREEQEKRKGAKKNVKLLSFGADENDEDEPTSFPKKAIFRPDLEDVGPSSSQPAFLTQPPPKPKRSNEESATASVADDEFQAEKPPKRKDESDITKIRQRHAEEQAASLSAKALEISKMEEDIRRLNKRRDGEDSDDEHIKKKPKKSYLQEELDKYSKGRGLHKKGKRKDEGDILAALNNFRTKLQGSVEKTMDADDIEMGEEDAGKDRGGEDAGLEVDDDRGFMNHALHFPKDDGEETRKAERDYEVIDPRQRNARAKEEEREKKRLAKARGGGGGGRRR
ncbi:hypothetical protein H0H93_006391 [Arthromyces matolae]|nr:hypothetical protein H0H93_006391 [Arthromyces matolae]